MNRKRPLWTWLGLMVLLFLAFNRVQTFRENLIAHAWIPAALAFAGALGWCFLLRELWDKEYDEITEEEK